MPRAIRGPRRKVGKVHVGLKKGKGMNRTEQRYAKALDADPDCVKWHFESVKLRLAENTFYTCDFVWISKAGEVFADEVKARWG